jgi:hypothetical protein
MRIIYLLLLFLVSGHLTACNGKDANASNGSRLSNLNSSSTTDSMKLKITIGRKVAHATLHDNPTTRDFIALLPLTLTLTDYNATEKISDLPKILSTKDAPVGYKPSVGDITLYAPWGHLAIFYKDFSYSNGLISLGKITSGIQALNASGPIKAKFELE